MGIRQQGLGKSGIPRFKCSRNWQEKNQESRLKKYLTFVFIHSTVNN